LLTMDFVTTMCLSPITISEEVGHVWLMIHSKKMLGIVILET
jgi:hypothetical protein